MSLSFQKSGLRLAVIALACLPLCGCYTYTQTNEDDADRAFSVAGQEYSAQKAEENLIRARRDKFVLDSNFAEAAHEDSLLRKQEAVTKASKARYDIARSNAINTRAGTERPESPISIFFGLFKPKKNR